jgi:hypothetical protein
MIKHEIRVELTNKDDLMKIIDKSYFKEGFGGKITDSKKNFIKIEDDVNVAIFSGLHNATVKVMNEELIDGAMRFLIEDDDKGIRLYPISIYCIKVEDKYSFY